MEPIYFVIRKKVVEGGPWIFVAAFTDIYSATNTRRHLDQAIRKWIYRVMVEDFQESQLMERSF